MVALEALISARDETLNHLAISQHVNKITMATTTTTTPNAPDLLTLVTDTESIVSSIDTLTSYLDSELARTTLIVVSAFFVAALLLPRSTMVCFAVPSTQTAIRFSW